MDIRKTNGKIEEYDQDKLISSICAAYNAIGETCDEVLLKTAVNNFYLYDNIATSEIRRQVEEWLMFSNKKAAKAYIENNNDGKDIKKKQDFITSYIAAINPATGSKFDSNANVSNKNIVTLGQELYKENNIKQNRYILTNKIASMYTKKLAKQYINDIESHVLYKHDETGTPGYPYTYSAKEVVEVSYMGKNMLLPFDLLYDIVDENEVLVDEENIVYQKTPQFLFIKDNENKYTPVTKLTRKKRHRSLVRVKTSFGEDLVVTDNHPMITDINDIENTTPASDVSGCKQWKTGNTLNFKNNKTIDLFRLLPTWVDVDECFIKYNGKTMKRVIDVTRTFGYLVGFFVGDGNYNNTEKTLVYTQTNKEILEKINRMFYDVFGFIGKIKKEEYDKCVKYTLTITNRYIYEVFRGYFKIQDKSYNKTLPYNILEYTEDFALGCLEGLLDSDGTISQSGTQITIRLASRACILQATQLFKYFNYTVGNLFYDTPFSCNSSYKSNYALWGVNATVYDDSAKFIMSEKFNKNGMISTAKSKKYKVSGYVKVSDVTEIQDSCSYYTQNDYIYDITTETHTFSCNNILVHNCVAITMYPFLVDGLKKLGGVSVAPTDLKSFCGEFINLVYSVSSQFLGAVATPEFLMYLDYFIRKDYSDDYLDRLSEVVENTSKQRSLEKVIENCFQQVVHSMNMPAGNRGYQCVREDTTQLMTPNGFKYLSELKEGDDCYVWKDGKLYIEPIKKLNVYDFDGELYQFKGRNYQQTVTDSHRVLYKVPNTNKYNIKEAKDLFGHSKLSLPIGSEGVQVEDFPICDELLKLCIITLTDGSIDSLEPNDINSGRITIYKSKNRWGYKEIPELLTAMGIGYNETEINGNEYGDMVQFRIPKIESQIILRQINHTKKSLPKFLKMLSKRQIDIVLDIWSKTDGYVDDKHGVYLQCDNVDIQNDLQEIAFLGGYGTKIYKQECNKFNGSGKNFTNYVKIFKRKDKRVSEYNKVRYTGKVWCPTTDAGIVVFREENGIPYISGNSVFWNISYFDHEYFKGVFGEFRFPDGSEPKWETLSWLQKKFMKWFNEERTKYVLTFPVETMALLTDGSDDFIDKEYADFTAEMWAEGHSFFCYLSDSPDSLSSCCRLRNSLKDNKLEDEEHNHTTHQYSMGTASVSTGSKSVMTINLPRLVQNSANRYFKDNDIEIVKGKQIPLSRCDKNLLYQYIREDVSEMVERVHKYQTAFNETIKDFLKANMLDVYNAGFIDIRKQYLTVGVNGITDAAEYFKIKVSDNDEYREFVNNILETINICNKKDKTRDTMFNCEFVPAENLAAKNYNWDRKDGYWVSPDRNLYSSYFYNPEDSSLSVLDKMKLHGKEYVQYLDGGSALHANLREHLSKAQYRQLLKVAAQNGCNYFTFNILNSCCEDCGHIDKNTLDECPVCGSKNISYLTRVIGYLKKINSFSEPRQVEAAKRYYMKD